MTALPRGVIDVHTHVCTPDFPVDPSEGGLAGWPCMAHDGKCGSVMIDGKLFRKLDERSWETARRIEDMDREGVAIQALSPMPELLSYWFDKDRAVRMCDHVNGFIADLVSRTPERFCGLGMVPMQFPDVAADYLPRIKKEFGLQGIEIGSNVAGVLPGDSRLHPIFAAAEGLDLAIFVHALHPLTTKEVDGPPWFAPAVGFSLDVGMAAASLIAEGVINRFPCLRLAFSHGGGALSSLLGRLDRAWRMTDRFSGTMTESPSTQARGFFYDSNVYDPGLLKLLVEHTAPDHVFLGTDYPYDIMQTDPLTYLSSAGLSERDLVSLQHEAARSFLGL